MKKIILFAIIAISFAACKPKKPWTEDALVNDCLKTFNERNAKEPRFTGMQIPLLCKCMSEKMIAKYKTEAESDKDQSGVTQITQECLGEVMSK